MGDLSAYIVLGFRHIVDLRAADHLLFLLVLGAIYRPAHWREMLTVVTAFTVGHSLTLVLAAAGAIPLQAAWIEFLIPVTIVATGMENLAQRDRIARGEFGRHRPVLALLFGLVHGAGFAGYLRSLLVDDLVWPLLGFNIGVEAGQVVILLVAASLFGALDAAFGTALGTRLGTTHRTAHGTAHGPGLTQGARGVTAFRWRLSAVSATVTSVAAVWAWDRIP